MLAVSRDDGLTWSTPLSLSTVPTLSPSLALAGDGSAIVVSRPVNQDAVWFQVSSDQGATWSEPRAIPGLLRRYFSPDEMDGMQLKTDSAGVVHLALVARPDAAATQNAVYHLTWDGKAWSAPEEVFRTSGTAEWPRLAIGNGNLMHLVWFERDTVWRTDGAAYKIWHSRALAEAPGIRREEWPERRLRLMSRQTVFTLVQLIAALFVVGVVIRWARRHGL
jgi:hypothetical protein